MTIYNFLQHHLGLPAVFQAVLLAAALLVGSGLLVRRHLASLADGGLVPDRGLSLRNVLEMGVEALLGVARDTIGEDYRRFAGFLLALFSFILISNFLNLLPGVGGATSFADTTWAWALISYCVYNWVGMRHHGFRYILHFCGPGFDIPLAGRHYHIHLFAPIFLPFEIFLHAVRILTLAVRLLANMFADHLVVVVWVGLVPFFIPAIFFGLGTLIAVVQAFVFTLLTAVYIGMALEEPH